MKVNCRILLESNKEEVETLQKEYTISVARTIASDLSLEDIDELIEKICLKN
ncbi:hypothetical protein LGK97_01485 [Clostridium sp. CS001]|uniref:hypothetical protein n=1 Tax=Clostridium sp. CS001 TaxID=2880648 RepID=UPI001CF2C297|nr:hypothetical protein [Clostridium sp. CS001]MCB2288439.1 hypothetical protein [Clostridium sp. CS001]